MIEVTEGVIYTCPFVAPGVCEKGRFGNWTLNDFTQALSLYENKPSVTLVRHY